MENIKVNIDLVDLFIQRNNTFYKSKFDKMKKSGKSASWNWSAFLMGIYWMIYRKMYFKAAAFTLLSFVALKTPFIGSALQFCILIGIGVFANALYLDHVEDKIKKATLLSPHKKEEVIMKKGGTNLPLAIGLGVIHQIAVVVMVIMYI